ncbi:MAG: hypothetical protein AB7G23_19135 [Vicinamibacterales bacterium]
MAGWIVWVRVDAPDITAARRRVEHLLAGAAAIDEVQSEVSYRISVEEREAADRQRRRRREEEDW